MSQQSNSIDSPAEPRGIVHRPALLHARAPRHAIYHMADRLRYCLFSLPVQQKKVKKVYIVKCPGKTISRLWCSGSHATLPSLGQVETRVRFAVGARKKCNPSIHFFGHERETPESNIFTLQPPLPSKRLAIELKTAPLYTLSCVEPYRV